MDAKSLRFLKQLLDSPGPSGFEQIPARVWREEARTITDRVEGDQNGNSYATLGPEEAPRVMLAGHIDEIGVMVTHIDENGMLYIAGVGGWDTQVLVGQRILLLTRSGTITGVVGKKAIHLMETEERKKVSEFKDLWVDIAVSSREEALERGVRVGDAGVIDTQVLEMGNDVIASRSIDNRIGSFVVLEALRYLKMWNAKLKIRVTAVATVQEEIGNFTGATTAAYRVSPEVAIAVDVTHATDTPSIEKKLVGEHELGSGPVLARGSANHPAVFESLADAAEKAEIPYTISAKPRSTSTDADALHLSRTGVATALLSVPNRYMHSPNEIVSLADLDASARLIATYLSRLTAEEVAGYGERF